MARKRQIDPIYPLEQEIAQLSIPARYFYIISWCHQDDENGVMPYDIFMLKGQIFPADHLDVEEIIQELIAARRYFPFEAQGKRWIWCPTMTKHQTINHPTKSKYPAPSVALRENYRNTTEALPQSRVELSRVELNSKQASPALKAVLDKVYKEGLNIYALINKMKKQTGWKQDQHFPEGVLVRVCEQYHKDKIKIKKQWPWFCRVLIAETERYFADKNISEHKAIKQAGGMSLAQILNMAAQKLK